MTSSTQINPGSVLAVEFDFTSGRGRKRRPVVVISGSDYQNSRADAIVVALSTSTKPYFGDCEITDWRAAGLPAASKAKGVVRTVETARFIHYYGQLSVSDLTNVRESLRKILEL